MGQRRVALIALAHVAPVIIAIVARVPTAMLARNAVFHEKFTFAINASPRRVDVLPVAHRAHAPTVLVQACMAREQLAHATGWH